MTAKLKEIDPVTGVQTWHEYDASTDTTYIAEIQDCAPILEMNKAFRNHGTSKKGINDLAREGFKKGFTHAGLFPLWVLHDMKKRHGVDPFNKHQSKEFKKLLNHSDYAVWRTGTFRV